MLSWWLFTWVHVLSSLFYSILAQVLLEGSCVCSHTRINWEQLQWAKGTCTRGKTGGGLTVCSPFFWVQNYAELVSVLQFSVCAPFLFHQLAVQHLHKLAWSACKEKATVAGQREGWEYTGICVFLWSVSSGFSQLCSMVSIFFHSSVQILHPSALVPVAEADSWD